MGQIMVRNLDDAVIERLKQKAKRDKISLEQTARDAPTRRSNLPALKS
jgi:plasmid stability protein